MDLNFNSCKILIVGDVMLDKYYFGKVERISRKLQFDSKHRDRGIPFRAGPQTWPTTSQVSVGRPRYAGLSAMTFSGRD